MDVDTSVKILVVILSSTLAIFLILAIVAIIKLIQILRYLKRIMQKADEIADKAEHVAEFFERSTTTVAVGRLISNIANIVSKKGKK